MANYLKTTKTYSHKRFGVVKVNGKDYKKVWYELTFNITVAADGKISYKITSKNNADSITGWTSKGCKVSAWIEINGTSVLSSKYYTDSSGPTGYTSFPYKNNSTYKGSLSSKTTNNSITIKSKLIPGSDYTGWTEAWKDSLSISTLTRDTYTDVSTGSVSITENYDNSYTVKGTGGSAGTNNAVTEAKLTYTSVKITNGVETVYTAEEDCNGKTVKKTVKFTPTSKSNTRQVTAKVDTKGTYNDPTAVSQTLAVKQYVAPGALSSPPTITSPDLTKTRLTNKKNWVFSWGAAADANDNSPVKGYRVYLYKKSAGNTKFVPATIYGHNFIPKEYYDTTNKSLTIYPLASNIDKYNFKPGDSVLLGVRPYTQYGNHNLGEKLLGTIEYSNYPNGYEVKNAGVVKVKTSGGWKEGQVYVKTSGGWKEAESVQIKTDKGWKESE